MPRILVTGMSGAGKSTLLDELRRRGHRTVDTDDDGWILADGTWDEPRHDARLLDENPDVVVAGTVENQGRFYDRFEHVILLSAPARRPARTRRDPDEQPVRHDARRPRRDRALRRDGRTTAPPRRQPSSSDGRRDSRMR